MKPEPGEHAQAGLAALVVGHVDEAADAAEQAVLERIEHPVGIGHLPQQLDHVETPLARQAVVDGAGEAEQLGRVIGATFGRGLERVGLFGRETEAALEQLPDQAAFRLVQAVVDCGDLDKQRGDCDFELVPVVSRDLAPRPLLEQRPQAIEHMRSVPCAPTPFNPSKSEDNHRNCGAARPIGFVR